MIIENELKDFDDMFGNAPKWDMSLLPDTPNCGLHMRRNAGNVFPATAG